MEDQGEENTDGSSIKPVSSLRSHFEQMAKSTTLNPPNVPPPRPTSPKPKIDLSSRVGISNGDIAKTQTSYGIRQDLTPTESPSLKPSVLPPIKDRPLSTGYISPKPYSPAVTVDPPSSPPKGLSTDLSTAPSSPNPSNAPGMASPRHFRIPSRPHTPTFNPQKSPSLTPSQPPEPPPPRRSGELQRIAQSKIPMGPPPVNRSDKPNVPVKQAGLGQHQSTKSLMPSASPRPQQNDGPSPFSTPPSDDNSPEAETLAPPKIRSRPISVDANILSQSSMALYDPPPIHHSVATRRREQETRSIMQSIDDAPDMRPALPTRNTIASPMLNDLEEQRPSLPARPGTLSSSKSFLDAARPSREVDPALDSSRLKIAATTRVARDEKNYPVPPKRNFSTPVSNSQTPPRSHGRSMTVDQTSDRIPSEFRTGTPSLGSALQPRDNLADNTRLGVALEASSVSNPAEYPDPSSSNRRPPFPREGPREILTRYDTRLVDMCGEFVCTAGLYTRVWSLVDGEQVMSLAHGETVRILSVSFKAAIRPEDEGRRLWLGNNIGEILEVDIPSQYLVTTKTNAHARHEVIKIYRHSNEMWTLDDSGTLHLWAPDSSGELSLTEPRQSYRVPKGHTFSMVVGDDLWFATGKDLRIFRPTVDGRTQFQVLQRPLTQANAGDITSGTVLDGQPDRVYLGHSDGKVSIYSKSDFNCLAVLNISMYKINSLAGIGAYLWAAYSSGMIYIYDIASTPWRVKKDWRAHENPVINILSDRSNYWQQERFSVVSLGADNVVRPWDGFLEQDWLEMEFQEQDARFCRFEQISTLVMTWNAGASTPHSLRYAEKDSNFFRELLQTSDAPDILVFGFQELVDLEDKRATAKSFFKSKKKDPAEQEHMSHQYRDWRDHLIRCLDDYTASDDMYHLLHSSSLVGLFTCIFVKSRLRDRITSLCGGEVKRGLGGLHGNKGALIVRFRIDDTSLCFINCHLAAGQSQTKDRNYDISAILESTLLPAERDPTVRLDSYYGGGDGTMVLDHEICIVNGDLNYRIDTMGRDAVVSAVKAGNLKKLLERDQLLVSRRKNPSFRLRAFHEAPITFDPTYKYDVGTDNYDSSEKKRAPAWCDRILYRGRNHLERIQQLDYRRHEVRVSDHRPVTAQFQMTIKTISPKKRAMVWEECQRRFAEVKPRLLPRSG